MGTRNRREAVRVARVVVVVVVVVSMPLEQTERNAEKGLDATSASQRKTAFSAKR
jgi:hypothetical protein